MNPYAAILAGVLAAAFSSIFTKLADAPPLIIAFYRMLFTVLILTPFVVKNGIRQIKEMKGGDLGLACLAGVFLALHFSFWITSLNYTSIASSTVLVTLQPLFVISGGYLFYGEKIAPRGAGGAVLALAGSLLIGIGDFQIGGKALLGDLLAFAGGFFVAGYVLIGRGLRNRLELIPYVYVVYTATAALLFLGNAAVYSDPLGPYPAMTWLWFAALALIPTIMGHTVFNWALRYVKAAVVSVSILGEPVGATILAFFIFGQVPGMLQLIGGLSILLGLALFISSTSGASR
ncbi:permease [Desulfocucumis palustris]|uniref:Permease n=1 Tax=Desulfocucumis palustris TaxID=1898651 RepID=A0A2L2XE64_9FIRM|nr:permease [Desulfocucumis palustris]